MKPIIVIDSEWHASTTADSIIQPKEIGVALVISGAEDTAIAAKPERHYIIKTSDEHHDTLSVSEILLNLGSSNSIWASYSWFDNVQLRKWFENEGIPFPLGKVHMDIAAMYTVLMRILTPPKLKDATTTLCGRFLGTQHRADDDAWNAARVLAKLMNQFNEGE